jgi:hypothetical protein
MVTTCRKKIGIQKSVEQVLSGLLVTLLALSSIVRAQQTPSQTPAIEQKQTGCKTFDEQPANLAVEPDHKDAKLAVYQVQISREDPCPS